MARKKADLADPVTDAVIANRRANGRASAPSLSALREKEAGLRRAQEMAGLAHVITKPDGSFESWSETLPGLIGVPHDEIVESTRKWLDLVHPADRQMFRDTALRARAEASRTDIEYRLWHRGGTWIHVRQVMEPIPGKPDEMGRLRWFNTLQDISSQKRAEERITRLNRVYSVLSGINSLIVRVRNRQELFQKACELAVQQGNFQMAWIGLADEEEARIRRVAWAGLAPSFKAERLSLREGASDYGLPGKVLRELRVGVSQDIQLDPERLHENKARYAELGINSLCILPLTIGGKGVGVLALYGSEVGFFDDEELRLLQELAGDVSFALDYLEKSERAEYLAYYDPLTGLANRTLFHERLAQHVQSAREKNESVALLLADIERFKTVNDTMGRQAGDRLLAELGKRITQAMPAVRASRIGSDVFAFVIPHVTPDELAHRVDESLKVIFGSPYRLGESELTLSSKIGIALYPNDATDEDYLFRNAEAALKRAKKTGDRYVFYEERMTERVAERLALENRLRRALENSEFVLHYQPKVDLEHRRVVGAEALLRWNSPELGLVPPLEFVQLLEETGLIVNVGYWAIRQAARDHRHCVEQGIAMPRIAVNLSAVQLRQRNFVQLVEEALTAGTRPPAIDLEITESLLMDDIQGNRAKLEAVRALGINLAMDDFGTGYSSLAYLARLPVQSLKIDRSFVSAMEDDPKATTLVSTMITLAHSLKLKVVAEGVETEAQAKLLRLLGCDEMQGYLFSKPLPLGELIALLARTGTATSR